jgi:hypothetical protein
MRCCRLCHLYESDLFSIWKFYAVMSQVSTGRLHLAVSRVYLALGAARTLLARRIPGHRSIKALQGEHREAFMICGELLKSIVAFGHRTPPARAVWLAMILASTTITVIGFGAQVQAEDAEISVRRGAERTSFTDDEIKDGFFKIAFHAELQVGPRAERIRKFDEPVRVFVVNRGAPDRRTDVAAVVADIRARVDHLDIVMTDDRRAANVVVTLVHERDLKQTIRSMFGPDRAKQIERSLSPECLSGFAKDPRYRIRRAEVILPVDAGEFMFYDCAYEELLQALGPINDDRSVPWTMFNDDVQMGFFDIYDQYLLNILYDPRVRPGMTKREVEEILHQVLPTVQAWVSRPNSRQGAEYRDRAQYDTPRAAIHRWHGSKIPRRFPTGPGSNDGPLVRYGFTGSADDGSPRMKSIP